MSTFYAICFICVHDKISKSKISNRKKIPVRYSVFQYYATSMFCLLIFCVWIGFFFLYSVFSIYCFGYCGASIICARYYAHRYFARSTFCRAILCDTQIMRFVIFDVCASDIFAIRYFAFRYFVRCPFYLCIRQFIGAPGENRKERKKFI